MSSTDISSDLGSSQDDSTPKALGHEADNLLEASVPYKLERGAVYLVEAKEWGLSKHEATLITQYYLKQHSIDIQFVFTAGQDFALQGIPAIEAENAGNDLAKKYPEAKND
jgi:hypothetical protein